MVSKNNAALAVGKGTTRLSWEAGKGSESEGSVGLGSGGGGAPIDDDGVDERGTSPGKGFRFSERETSGWVPGSRYGEATRPLNRREERWSTSRGSERGGAAVAVAASIRRKGIGGDTEGVAWEDGKDADEDAAGVPIRSLANEI